MMSRDEFLRLKDTCYLDHAGATLYSEKQIRDVMNDFSTFVYGNPHSLSVTSRQTTDIVDQIRYRVLQLFNTDLEEYDIIFTSGATAALKLIAESFDFGNGVAGLGTQNENQRAGVFVYSQENHTSVLGMREVVAERCSKVVSLPLEQLKNLLSVRTEHQQGDEDNSSSCNSLLAFPGQCNFSGLKTPLSWIENCHQGKLNSLSENKLNWFCLLDAASLVSTSPLDLSTHKPDFVAISFYKIFGYPTGLGALLVRNSSAHTLGQRRYFGGGTVLMAKSNKCEHILRPILHDRLEDGTIPFLSIIAVRHGLDTIERLMSSMVSVQKHTFRLARRTHHSLLSLQHSNGNPVAQLYCDTDFEDADTQGAIVNFNLLRPDGEFVGYNEVLNMANSHKIHLRTGCFCNPGACQRHLNLSEDDLDLHFQSGHVCGDDHDLINGTPTGSVRISFGYMSRESDVDIFLTMIYSCFVVQGLHRQPYYHSSKTSVEDEWCDALDYLPSESASTNEGMMENKIQDKVINPRSENSLNEFGNFQLSETAQSSNLRSAISLSQLCLFPVKSCGGFYPTGPWVVGQRGLAYDRLWMVLTPAGTALTQTQEPKLACIHPDVDLKQRMLHLTFAGNLKAIRVPLDEQEASSETDQQSISSFCQTKVCGDRVRGQDCGDEVANWLSNVLHRPGLRLIRQLDADRRNTPGNKQALALSNKAQFLLISETSVAWLGNQIHDDNFDKFGLVDRFRANLVIRGLDQPFQETSWKQLCIGNQLFKVDGPCTRCGVVCIDQSTGERTNEPLRTLSAALHSKVRFGMYLSHQPSGDDDGMCTVATGNSIKVVETDEFTHLKLL